MEQQIYGGIELGGTKTICALANAAGNLYAQITIPTTTADETLGAVYEFFRNNEPVVSLGVGSFGPINLDFNSAEYGHIGHTPKLGWSKVNVKGFLEEKLGLSVAIDTDVNCAALGEHYYGVAKQARNFVYLTLGTGIGGGLVINGDVVHGILNLEMGHMRIPHEPFTDSFKGVCMFHDDCFEGIASGPAMAKRYGRKPEEIKDENAWEKEASYIASAINNIMMTVGPQLIVLGGGLTNYDGLMANIRLEVQRNVNQYLDFPSLEGYIVKSSSDMNAALGAIKMASLRN